MTKISLDLDDELLFQLMLLAHEQDITLNQLINQILKEYLDKYVPDEYTAGQQ